MAFGMPESMAYSTPEISLARVDVDLVRLDGEPLSSRRGTQASEGDGDKRSGNDSCDNSMTEHCDYS